MEAHVKTQENSPSNPRNTQGRQKRERPGEILRQSHRRSPPAHTSASGARSHYPSHFVTAAPGHSYRGRSVRVRTMRACVCVCVFPRLLASRSIRAHAVRACKCTHAGPPRPQLRMHSPLATGHTAAPPGARPEPLLRETQGRPPPQQPPAGRGPGYSREAPVG